MSASESGTLLDAMCHSFAAAMRVPDGVSAPAALLWADSDGQWKALMPALKRDVRQIYEFGSYAPEISRGPAIWLKCIVDRTLPDASPQPDVTPILYLPGISRQDLRAGRDCPRALQPLIELQYRGAVWHQRNGRDWTIEAFLTSDDGLGLDIALDHATRIAMQRALPLLATMPVASLRGRRLDAEDFDELAIGDPIRDLLFWMSDPEAFERRYDGARLASFTSILLRDFKLDRDSDSPQTAAERLLHGGGKWDEAWQRFCDSPHLYAGIYALLRQAVPQDLLVETSRRPAINEEQEQLLKEALEALLALPHSLACERIFVLEHEHGKRRNWVWAQLGHSPYALALEPLARLAKAAKEPFGAASAQSMAEQYANDGWLCDRAAVDAMCSARRHREAELITRVACALYAPWLDQTARRFQELIAAPDIDPAKLVSAVDAEHETCIVFVDGLRYDVGALLQQKLEARGYRATLSHRISPIPTVTATAKPLASPAHALCHGKQAATDFAPLIRPSEQPASAVRLRDAMARQGVEVLEPGELRIATGGDTGGWTEVGEIDELGHGIQVLLLSHLDSQSDAIVERIIGLLDCGWMRVRVVTDHGWLLLPGGLPKCELPPSLVETKWARCAAVQGESHVSSVPTFPWYWNALARIASPPGIAAFRLSTEYAHGGVSLQECVVPDLIVERGEQGVNGRLLAITWRGMRCRVMVETNATGVVIDLRRNMKDPASSIVANTKIIPSSGEASLAVLEDKYEGAAATVVLVDGNGRVLDYKPTIVGEDE